MKNSVIWLLAALLLLDMTSALAQPKHAAKALERCGTMKNLQRWLDENPALAAENARTLQRLQQNPPVGNRGARLQANVTIPVVFHIVLPNPFSVTDADVQAQINRLNLDYSGLNPDSTNIPPAFQAVRGHSRLRFTLARRTPDGQLTNGIERRVSATEYDALATTDPIKTASKGGLDAWDYTQYLNVWVGTGGGLLGYATFPGTSSASQQGIVTDIIGTANNPCYIDPSYNMGRTLTHESAHYFGLYHIWGDDDACLASDFRNLVGSCTINDPTLAGGNNDQTIGDTPNQGNENYGCLSGTVQNSCGNAAGDMYQNFMDYTNDACMTMFTALQAARMEWIVANCRSGYLTTLGALPPAGTVALDAAPAAAINPGGFELLGCSNYVAYSDAFSCPGNVAPKFRVVNRGTTTLTSLVVGYRLDNGTAVTQTVSANLPTSTAYIASFTAIPVGIGNHTFKFFTASPNGSTDAVPSNDTLTQSFRVLAPVVAPLSEGFEAAPPFTSFGIDNPNGDVTWTRTMPGRNGSAGKLTFDNYNNNTANTHDDLRSAPVTVNPGAVYTLSFDVAHKYYNDPQYYDTLSVFISGDCGQTYTRIYQKWGAALAGAAGTSNQAFSTPADADWRTETMTLNSALLASGRIIVLFRNQGGYGNFIHLDNINIAPVSGRDLRLVSINTPGNTACSPALTPTVTLANDGESVTSFKVGYRIDNGADLVTTYTQTIATGGTATVSLPTGNAAVGSHVLTVFSADPVSLSGIGDARPTNDTLAKAFEVVSPQSLPLVEGFESSFPPAGWSLYNPNSNGTWTRRPPGRNSANAAFIDNFNVPGLTGQLDDLQLPFLNTSGADSVLVSFDVAYRNFPGFGDTLSVLATADCGNTLTPVYYKGGAGLATGSTASDEFISPLVNEWRTERITLAGKDFASSGLGLRFRNTNGYSNNIFVDNVNVAALFRRDLELVSLSGVPDLVCSGSATPRLTVRNAGYETITGFKVSYTINGSGLVTQTVTGLSLARGSQLSFNLPVVNAAAPGNFTVRLFGFEPVSQSGTGDMNTQNDTLTKGYSVPNTVTAPLSESFAAAVFPAAGWSRVNPDGAMTWSRYSAGNRNSGSAFLNSFAYASAGGQTDDLVTPFVRYTDADSVKLGFDVAAAPFLHLGGAGLAMDTLSVLVTKDCGNTFATVYKKWGANLQTVSDTALRQAGEFYPGTGQWRREAVDLTPYAGAGPLMVVFRLTSNGENNVFIDNVNLTTQTLPAPLKQQGYLVLPTVFRNSFRVWYYLNPTNLRFITVTSADGKVLWHRQFWGNAPRQTDVDLTGKASGIYFVSLSYTDGRTVVQRVVKY